MENELEQEFVQDADADEEEEENFETVKLKPGENLHFTVLLPDGTPMLFDSPSRMFFLPNFRFPIVDDPLAQVSATFEIV